MVFPGGQPGKNLPSIPTRDFRNLAFLFAALTKKGARNDGTTSPRASGKNTGPRSAPGIFTAMEQNAKTTNRHGSNKRPNRIEISFSDQELKKVKALAREAGQDKIPTFVRNFILGGGVVEAAVTEQDRKDIAQLSKIGANLWQLRKDLKEYGLDNQFLSDLREFSEKFKTILPYYFSKIGRE